MNHHRTDTLCQYGLLHSRGCPVAGCETALGHSPHGATYVACTTPQACQQAHPLPLPWRAHKPLPASA